MKMKVVCSMITYQVEQGEKGEVLPTGKLEAYFKPADTSLFTFGSAKVVGFEKGTYQVGESYELGVE